MFCVCVFGVRVFVCSGCVSVFVCGVCVFLCGRPCVVCVWCVCWVDVFGVCVCVLWLCVCVGCVCMVCGEGVYMRGLCREYLFVCVVLVCVCINKPKYSTLLAAHMISLIYKKFLSVSENFHSLFP